MAGCDVSCRACSSTTCSGPRQGACESSLAYGESLQGSCSSYLPKIHYYLPRSVLEAAHGFEQASQGEALENPFLVVTETKDRLSAPRT